MKVLVFLMFFTGIILADNSVGCGLGSLIIKRQSVVSALFRATTNHSFSSQLFGITTGTSGCSQHSIVKNEMAPVYFAEANLETLKIEMAQGHGEYLSAFVSTLKCKNRPDVYSNLMKNNYNRIFPADGVKPYEMLKNVSSIINENEDTKGQCEYLFT